MSQSSVLILTGDLKGAYLKWLESSNRWKEHWFECCSEIYNGKKCKKEYKRRYVINDEDHTISKRKFEMAEDGIQYVGCDRIPNPTKDKELLYWIEMQNADDKICYYKGGTTTREIEQRMKEHLEYYEEEGIAKIKVKAVIDCGEIPAEGLESFIRAQMIKQHPNAFKKNDRFIADEVAEMDLQLVYQWANEYLNQ